MSSILHGRVLNDADTALSGATVLLIARSDVLSADPQAAVFFPGSVSWTRPLSGFAGAIWNCWQSFVARSVAGITWEAFRREVLEYNPSLHRSGGRFEADQTYMLPENRSFSDTRSVAPAITWDREVTGFAGSLWDAWQRFVRSKVISLTWNAFQQEVRSANPHLTGTAFRAEQTYRLPRNPDLAEYHRLAICDDEGRFVFTNVPAGSYRLEVRASGYRHLRRTVEGIEDTSFDLHMQPIPIFDDRADPYVRTNGRELVFNGQALRFIGVNLRGLVHYGDTGTLAFTEVRHQEEQLRAASEMGARVVRVFLPSEHATTEQAIARLESLLGTMRAQFSHMFLIVCLTNLYNDTPFRVNGDDEFYKVEWDGKKLLSPDWFREDYKRNYLPFVGSVVQRFRGERQILAWEPGNELKVNDNPDLLVQFMQSMARTIRGLDTNHLITTGMVSTRHAFMKSRPEWFQYRDKLYGFPLIDFITVHAYNGKNKEDDSDLSVTHNKPFIVEEAGFDRFESPDPDEPILHTCQDRDRAPCVDADMNKWFGRGASGYMQWAFMVGLNNGDGDDKCGFDTVFHNYDWEPLRSAYNTRARDLRDAAPVIATHRPLALVSEKMAPQPPLPVKPAAPSRPGEPLITTTTVRVRRTPGYKQKLASDIIGRAAPGTPVQPLGPTARADDLDWSMVSVRLDSGQTVQGWMAHAIGSQTLLADVG